MFGLSCPILSSERARRPRQSTAQKGGIQFYASIRDHLQSHPNEEALKRIWVASMGEMLRRAGEGYY